MFPAPFVVGTVVAKDKIPQFAAFINLPKTKENKMENKTTLHPIHPTLPIYFVAGDQVDPPFKRRGRSTGRLAG